MKLSQFITEHEDEILVEWEKFAKTMLPAAESMSRMELRDHAKQILLAIAKDIDTQQTSVQQNRKSKGLASTAGDSAASTHGTLRQVCGFTLLQLAAEYRALRATVLRLWLPAAGEMTDIVINDMMRFNEAIDQALAESVMTYSSHAEVVRDTFLAILGHDLRSPLGTMTMAGDYLTQASVGTDITLQIGLRVKRSAATMNAMVNDLLEYARSQLSGEMPIARSHVDVRELCQAAINDVSSAHPDCAFKLNASGNLLGNFDGMRLHQVLSNLLNNAAQYRGKQHPVSISVVGKADELVIEVQNFGPVIPPDSLRTVFDPLVQLPVGEQQTGRPTNSMGLGLFIASEITTAHGGSISVRSDEASGTIFRVQLPHHPDAPVDLAGTPA